MGTPLERLRVGARRRLQAAWASIRELRIPALPAPDPGDVEYGVLFVCHGNICRSPLAQGILRERLAEAGLGRRVIVGSAGTSGANRGRRPDPRARHLMLLRHQSIGDLRARKFEPNDFDKFDLILVMDDTDRAEVLRLARYDSDRRRVHLVAEYTDGAQIADPALGTAQDFAEAHEAIDRACAALVPYVASALRQRSTQ